MSRIAPKNQLFFRSSRAAYDQVTELYDFVWPASAALWNLKWQVAGYSAQNPKVTQEELNSRFVLGSGIHGVNLRYSCIDSSWEQQQAQFAKFLLIDLFAIYEAWLETTLSSLNKKVLVTKFQFPTVSKRGSPSDGIGFALGRLHQNESSILKGTIYPALLTHKKNSLAHLEALLICYRCFKECRNSLMHRGAIADQRTEDAYTSYSALTAADLGLRDYPQCPAIVTGKEVRLLIRGVVGFSDAILHLIATLDAEFARTHAAEAEFQAQWLNINGRGKMLKADPAKRGRKISKLVARLKIPEPASTSGLEAYLRAKHLLG
jgi:hypothetical protein